MNPASYEEEALVAQYYLLHYGKPREILPYDFGPAEAIDFPVRCVTELIDPGLVPESARALDVGCAVGRSAFELSRVAGQVIGVDYSSAFIRVARQMQTDRVVPFRYPVEGSNFEEAEAEIPDDVRPGLIKFEVGDAMELAPELAGFDIVLAANLICRLREPMKFIERLPALVKPGGQLLLCTPWTWLEDFTPMENWIGGREGVRSFEALKALLEPGFELALEKDLPFFIREHSRKFQWSVSHGSRWIRRHDD